MHTSNTEVPAGKFLGELCSKGHDWNGTGKSLRLKSTGRCIECRKEYAQANKERLNKKRMERYYKNYEEEKEKRKIYMEKRRKDPAIIERHKAYMNRRRREAGVQTREQMYANLAMKRLKRHLRDMKPVTVLDLVLAEQDFYDKSEDSTVGKTLYGRQKAKLRKAMAKGNLHFGHISRAEMIKRWKDFDNSCAYCGHKPADPLELEVEHVQPISQGGPHTLSNIVPACKACNTSKHKHDMVKWYRKQPFYDKKREAHIKQVLASTPYPEQQLELLHQWQVAG
jgi:5-methylcytosine-specific restriction endonuclease McrA